MNLSQGSSSKLKKVKSNQAWESVKSGKSKAAHPSPAAKPKRRTREDAVKITIRADHAELIQRLRPLTYASFRDNALFIFWQGMQGWREGNELREYELATTHPAFAKEPQDYKPGPRRITLPGDYVIIAQFITGLYSLQRPHDKGFQAKAEEIVSLRLLRGQGGVDVFPDSITDAPEPEAAPEPAPTPEPERAPRVSWPQGITGHPTATADDLPDLFGPEATA